jgi:cytosine/adenosine deaminase-related metal-dependent hydrolase
VVTIEGGRIVEVGDRTGAEVADLGNVAILPGMVNAHTHLEFSDLAAPLGHPGIPLTDWIGRLLEHRRQSGRSLERAVRLGLDESACSGTAAVGEIAQHGWPVACFQQAPLGSVVFLEQIAPCAERIAGVFESACRHLDAAASSVWRPGLSPHAAYSVHPELLARLVALSAVREVPLAMHLAESPEEIEFLRHGRGPLRDFLGRVEGWDPSAFAPGRRPLDFLVALAAAYRTLVVHGNYLDQEEIAFLAGHADRMTVVYCPRSHAFFGHAPHPLPRLLEAGVAVALGTDSRASAPDLSVLAEMRVVARRYPAIPGEKVLELGTLAGARALGLQSALGSIEPGKPARLAIVGLPDRRAADPHELLFDSAEPIVPTAP